MLFAEYVPTHASFNKVKYLYNNSKIIYNLSDKVIIVAICSL